MSESNLPPANNNFLERIQECTACIFLINECLLILNDKRETLEEKMIKNDFQHTTVALSQCLERLHDLCLSDAPSVGPSLQSLAVILADLKTQVSEFLKIVQYDLNFLEQYFEYDFNNRLLNEYQFPARLEKFLSEIDKCPGETSATS